MRYLKLLILISLTFVVHAKVHILTYGDKSVEVIQKGERYYSKECEKPKECFNFPKKLKFSPSSNPLFSLCLQSDGAAYFGKVSDTTLSICESKDGYIVDLNSMMSVFMKRL